MNGLNPPTTVGRISFTMSLEHLEPLFAEHYEELSLHKGRFPLAPDYITYATLELEGRLVFMALKREGDILGYFSTIVKPGLHYHTCLTAHPDMFFIAKQHRGYGAGAFRLVRGMEKELRRIGVQYWQTTAKIGHRNGQRLLEASGFTPTDVVYGKWLTAASGNT